MFHRCESRGGTSVDKTYRAMNAGRQMYPKKHNILDSIY